MARFGPKGRVEEATQVPMFACIALFVVAGFYFSFQAGASTEVRPKTLPHESLQLQHKLLREKLSDCKTKLNEHEGSSQKRSQRSHALHEKNTKLTTEEQQLNSKLLDCHYQKEDQQSKWSEEDKLNAGLVQSLSEKRDGVKGNASHLTKTRGMQHVLLDYSLTKLKRENSLLRESLGLERTTEADSEFYDNLVAKWHAKMNATGRFVGLNPNRTEFSHIKKRKTNITDNYERSLETAKNKVFFQKLENGEYQVPTWGKKQGTQAVMKGVHDQNHVTKGTLPRILRTLFDYALCAMNAKEDFIFPTHFRSSATSPVHSLAPILDTPLVTFCYGCKPQDTTTEFRLACEGFSTAELYGSIMFWRMRSRIRFAPQILHDADAFVSDNGLENTLAVRVLRKHTTDCQQSEAIPQLSYTRLLKGKTKVLGESAADHCAPSDEVVVAAIQKILAKTKLERVYLSTDANEDEVAGISAHISVPVVVAQLTDNPKTHAQDIIVASKSKYLIVPRYDVHASQMIEFFVLENKLRTDNIAVW